MEVTHLVLPIYGYQVLQLENLIRFAKITVRLKLWITFGTNNFRSNIKVSNILSII